MYLFLGIYIFILLSISFYLGRKNTSEDFLIAGRNRGATQIMLSKFAASVGMGWFISFTAYTYQYGVSTVILYLTLIMSFMLFSFWAIPRIYKGSRENKIYTHGQWAELKTNSTLVRKICDGFIIIQALLWYITAIIGGAKVIEFLNILSYNWAVVLTSLVVLSYILIAGFKVVVITDIIQSIIILVFLVLIVFALPLQTSNPLDLLSIQTENAPVFLIAGFLIYGLFSVFSSADRFPLIFAAGSAKKAKNGMLWGIVPTIFVMFLLLLVGLFVYSNNPNLDPDLAFLEIFNYIKEPFVSIAAVMLFAGLMSSADTSIYIISSFIAMWNRKEGAVKRIRIISAILVFSVAIFTLFVKTILGVSIFAAGFSLILSIPIIYLISGGINKNKFITSFIFSCIGFIVGLFIVGVEPAVAIFPIIFGALGLVSLAKIRFTK